MCKFPLFRDWLKILFSFSSCVCLIFTQYSNTHVFTSLPRRSLLSLRLLASPPSNISLMQTSPTISPSPASASIWALSTRPKFLWSLGHTLGAEIPRRRSPSRSSWSPRGRALRLIRITDPAGIRSGRLMEMTLVSWARRGRVVLRSCRGVKY